MTNVILDRSEWLINGARGFENELTEILDLVDGYVVDATLPVNVEDVEYYPDSFCLQTIEDIKNLVQGIKISSKVYAVDVVTVTTADVCKVSAEDRETLKVLSENIKSIDLKIKNKQVESLNKNLSSELVNSENSAEPAALPAESTEEESSDLELESSIEVSEPPIVTIEELEAELSNAKLTFKSKNDEVYGALPNISIYQIRLTAV